MFTEGKPAPLLPHPAAPPGVGCRSDLLYKGALQDNSRIVWRGMIHVDRDAQKTDGYQRNDNLMLSESARADSIPGLEIWPTTSCTHGATIGRVDDELIFYASTRGLTRKEAIRMIVAGFFQQVFDRITIPSVRDALGEAIGRRVRELLMVPTMRMYRFHPRLQSATIFPTGHAGLRGRQRFVACFTSRAVLGLGRLLHTRRRSAGEGKIGGIHRRLARGTVPSSTFATAGP